MRVITPLGAIPQATSCTIFPGASPPLANTLPAGPERISCGTDTCAPSLVLIQRMKMGFALSSSSSALPARAALRLILGACFLSSLLMVSICSPG